MGSAYHMQQKSYSANKLNLIHMHIHVHCIYMYIYCLHHCTCTYLLTEFQCI